MDYENDTSWVRGLLRPGENLLWTGAPGMKRLFRKEDVFVIPFSIVWFGFVIFFLINVLRQGTPLMLLFMIPFLLAGLYVTVGRFGLEILRRKKTRYALTSQRLILRVGKTVRSTDLLTLPAMNVTQRSDGSGDICFGSSGFRRSWGPYGNSGAWSYGRRYGYEGAFAELISIPDVARVEYRIHSAIEQCRQASTQA